MKKFIFLLGILLQGVLVSCTEKEYDDEFVMPNVPPKTEVKLSKAISSRCSSNDNVFGENEYWKVIDHLNCNDNCHHTSLKKFWDYHPASDVSKEEADYVFEYMKQHPNEGTKEFKHYNYYIQFVGCANNTYETTNKDGNKVSVSNTNSMNELCFQFDGSSNFERMNDYNANSGTTALLVNSNITNVKYKDSYSGTENVGNYAFYTILLKDGTKAMYLGLDYSTNKDGESINVKCDGIYNDYVIKVIPCCEDEDAQIVKKVETNLSIKDNLKEDLSFKASIHVRDVTDFDMFIPVPMEYMCDVDDLSIVETHNDENYTYGSASQIVIRTINGNDVMLNVIHEQYGIRLTSNGINKDVIKHLNDVYGDGVTFEITFYTNGLIDFDTLKSLLNASTIKCDTDSFVNSKPSEILDCDVTKID